MNEIDRILMAEPSPAPSPGFAAAVMEAVRREERAERAPAPLPFPWRPVLLGVLAACGINLLVVPALLTGGGPAGLADLLLRPAGAWQALVWLPVALAATWAAAVLPVRWLEG
jgi:hypothetical protein